MTKKKPKKGKGSKEQEKTVAKKSKTILKRKQMRKDKRQAKKTAKRDFVMKKLKGNRPRSQADDEEIPSDDEISVQKPQKAKKLAVQKQSDHDKVKKDMKELKRQQKKQRKTQLLAANEAEEKGIKMLEKNLGLKRRKSKNLPKSFLDDGLDYLLDACDSSKIATFEKEILDEESPGEDEDDEAVMRELGLNDGSSDSEDMEMDDQEDNDDEVEQEEVQEDDNDEIAGDSSDEESSEGGSLNGSDNEDELINEPEQDVIVKEDIYGRKRDAEGNILREDHDEPTSGTSKYIPPALRNKMANLEDSEQKRLALQRLSRQIKGLLNRLAESNMHGIARDIERFYNSNSRNDVNQTLAGIIMRKSVNTRFYYCSFRFVAWLSCSRDCGDSSEANHGALHAGGHPPRQRGHRGGGLHSPGGCPQVQLGIYGH